jgi:glycosyltransferase involved in cell wall biosynthesis
VPISVVVLTRDEEVNIGACLEHLTQITDDVVVLDSYSTDRTLEIVRQFEEVRLEQREFDTEYKQRNYSLHEITYRYPWLYICDADERLSDELVEEIRAVVSRPDRPQLAYKLRYKNMFFGKWIKHATTYPVWLIRLVRPDRVHYEQRATNVHPQPDGPVGSLNGHFIHYSFNAGLVRWFQKHNFYSDKEALEGLRYRRTRPPMRELFALDPTVRRRAMKNLSFRLPGRAFFRFTYNYVFQLGFLDGRPGLRYCLMIAMYEYWIELKMREGLEAWLEHTDAAARRILERDS